MTGPVGRQTDKQLLGNQPDVIVELTRSRRPRVDSKIKKMEHKIIEKEQWEKY